jgi:sulfane dehydrogenase subunit SoxC
LIVPARVLQPLEFDMAILVRYPMVTRTLFIECGGNSNSGWNEIPVQAPVGYLHGLASCSEWTGVPLSLILAEAGLEADARWMIAEGADALAMNVSVPVEKALDDAMLALYQNGERIRPENGYPLRLIVPGWDGVLNVKWLRRLQLAGQPIMARNETSRYTELLPSGKARQFTFFIEAKSLITHPSMGMQLERGGWYELSGLAWSGRGPNTSVEVSVDGGVNRSHATLQEPVLPRAFTRFRLPWRWNGEVAVLQSRATDETGYVQPTRARLVAERGRWGYFHYNAIVSWEVSPEGFLSHVYV